jgi:hypothetical protein
MRGQGRWAAPGSPGWEAFGLQWDKASVEGARFGLNAGEVLAAGRIPDMTVAEYAALQRVRNVDDFRQLEERLAESQEVRAQARRDLELERVKAALRGAE